MIRWLESHVVVLQIMWFRHWIMLKQMEQKQFILSRIPTRLKLQKLM